MKINFNKLHHFFLRIVFLIPIVCLSQQLEAQEELEAIDDQVQTLKKDVIQINHELSLLEEKLLFPSTTQVAVFVSLKSALELDSIQIKINTQVVGNHVYTFRELEALKKGGVQKLYVGNVVTGNHNIDVNIQGRTSETQVVQTASFAFKKDIGPKFVELQIVGTAKQPEIKFKDW